MLGFIPSSNEPSGVPATSTPPPAAGSSSPAPPAAGSSDPAPPAVPDKDDLPREGPSTSHPGPVITGAQAFTSEPVTLAISPPTPPASQRMPLPTRPSLESRGTQTLRPQTPPMAAVPRPIYPQARSLSSPAPAHFQDSSQPSGSGSGSFTPGQYYPSSPVRRSSRNNLPPLPESGNMPPQVRGIFPQNQPSGSNYRNGGDIASDNGSREDIDPNTGRMRSGSAVTQNRMTRYSGYDEKEFGVMEKERGNSNSLSRGTTLVEANKHLSHPFSAHSTHLKLSSTSRKTLAERLQPTLDTAINQRSKYASKARRTGFTLNAAIGAQVFLGALVTGLSAIGSGTGKNTGSATAVLGGFSTVVASYLARARGSNEPELSITRVKDLEHFVRECEAFMMDYGHIVVDEEDESDPANRELEQRMFRLRDRFEELLGNASGERKLSPPV